MSSIWSVLFVNWSSHTYSKQQSPSWEANWFSASQETPHILWKSKVHYCIYKSPPPVPILSHINPVHASYPISWRSILIWSSRPCLSLPCGLFPSVFPTKTLYAPLLTPILAMCPTHLIFLNLITQTIFDEQYRPLSSSMCSFLHSPVTSYLLGPNILLSSLYSNTLSLCSSLSVSHQVSHPNKTTSKIIVLCILLFIFLDSKLEENDSALDDSKHYLTSIRS